MNKPTPSIKAILTVTVMIAACLFWLAGLLSSPYLAPGTREHRVYVERYIQQNSPDLEQVRILAEAYWSRYPDVGADRHFGKQGIMGIHGARSHFNQHGKQEGRKWGK